MKHALLLIFLAGLSIVCIDAGCMQSSSKDKMNPVNQITSIKDTGKYFENQKNQSDSFFSWIGKYRTDSLWLKERKATGTSGNGYGMYKIDVRKDSIFFILEIEDYVLVGLYPFNYYCNAFTKGDTLFITTKGSYEGSEVNFTPIGKPVLKLYHHGGKIYGTGIKHGEDPDTYSLGYGIESDTLEFHRIE